MSDADLTVIVGIPTYNNAGTIRQTIEMILAQTRPPDRLVFCDKSTDMTPEIIREYAENDQGTSIEILRQESDGVAGAYDEILQYIQGEYDLFATVQSELLVDAEWLSGHVQIHQENPEIDIVNGDWKGREPTDREVRPDERPYYVGRNFSAKAGTLERIDGWDVGFLRGEDWDMRIRLAGAGVRSYACTALGYEWQQAEQDDPYITYAKAKRQPTSVTFLAKYGTWYLGFHPSHVASDLLSVGAIVTGVAGLVAMPLSVTSGLILLVLCGVSLLVYTIAHNALRGGVDGDVLTGPPRKQLLNGIAVLYASRRLARSNVEWNRTGFDPDNIPNYGF